MLNSAVKLISLLNNRRARLAAPKLMPRKASPQNPARTRTGLLSALSFAVLLYTRGFSKHKTFCSSSQNHCRAASAESTARGPLLTPRCTPERSRGCAAFHSGAPCSAAFKRLQTDTRRPRCAGRNTQPTGSSRREDARHARAHLEYPAGRAAAAPHAKMGRTTADDKKRMLLKIYHSKKEPFNLKELTKLAKASGLNDKLVQDINIQLMDDNYVSSDKIGSGNYFWAFPGSQGAQAKKQLEEAQANLKRATDRLAKAKVAEAAAKAGREDVDGSRAAKLQKLADLKTRRGNLESRLEMMKANDPEELQRIEKAAEDMKQHAIRWTENLFAVKDYLVQKKGVAAYQIDELFKSVGLPKNLDIE